MRESAVHAMLNEHFVLGESVFKFEEDFAKYCGTEFAVSTASGTAALVLSLISKKVRGAEVLTTPASFVASANAVIHARAIPRFADITLRTNTIDPAKINKSVGKKTRAIIPIHLYGFPAAMQEIRESVSNRNVALIEDACQAHGADYHGKKTGSLGDAGCFSFYPSKNMTVGGDGGMITTDDEALAQSLMSLRDCGRIKGRRYAHDVVGFTARLNTIQAAIGRVQLKRLDEWNNKRRQIASKYDELLSDLKQVKTPPKGTKTINPVYHMYVTRCQRRDALRTWLAEAGIETGVHYELPIHLQPVYRKMFGYKVGEFPKTELLCREALSLPMFPNLSLDEVQYVSERIHEFYGRHS